MKHGELNGGRSATTLLDLSHTRVKGGLKAGIVHTLHDCWILWVTCGGKTKTAEHSGELRFCRCYIN